MIAVNVGITQNILLQLLELEINHFIQYKESNYYLIIKYNEYVEFLINLLGISCEARQNYLLKLNFSLITNLIYKILISK